MVVVKELLDHHQWELLLSLLTDETPEDLRFKVYRDDPLDATDLLLVLTLFEEFVEKWELVFSPLELEEDASYQSSLQALLKLEEEL